MDSNLPKVSFIPKSPLAHKESFMERRRPRSITGFLAIFIFVVSVGAYVGLYFYDRSLVQKIETMTDKISTARRDLSRSPVIGEAKVFRVRAELAKELLDQHTVVSPVLDFLAQNTLQSIYYDDFSFKQESDGWTLTLSGEAPSYASLAYQADVLRQKKDNLVDFSVQNVELTKFGSIKFSLAITFARKDVSYTKAFASTGATEVFTAPEVPAVPPTVSTPAASTEPVSPVVPPLSAPAQAGMPATPETATGIPAVVAPETLGAPMPGWSVAPVEGAPAGVATAIPEAPSAWSAFWSRFKFW